MSYDYKAKQHNITQLNQYMLAKTLSMFEYDGLPKTLPSRELERMLQVNGVVAVAKHDGELYAFAGTMGGELDAYGTATTFIVANPYLKLNKTFKIGVDCVIIRNDDMCMGLIPLYNKTHSMMVENDINLTLFGFNSRTQKTISASDDKTKESAEMYLKKSIDGELAVIGENAFLEGVKVHPGGSSQTSQITSLVEDHQYLKAGLQNEVGLSANFNMKRERLNSSEVDQNEDSLFPLIYNMLQCRYFGLLEVEAMFNVSVKVDFGSVWKRKSLELIDNKIPETKEVENVNALENGNQNSNPAGTGTAEQKAEIEAMLLDESNTPEDIETLKLMLSELEK